MDKKNFILVVILCLCISIWTFIITYKSCEQEVEYYKEKSKQEQRLLWRISYTYPQQWELIKNTPEYYECKQYNIESINGY